MLLVAGGRQDRNLEALLRAAESLGTPALPLLLSPEDRSPFRWDIDSDALCIASVPVRPTALFVRQDVFSWLTSRKEADRIWAREWYQAIMGYALSRDDLRRLNASFSTGAVNKIQALLLARSVGLAIPKTIVANGPHGDAERDWVAKPLSGGDYCRGVSELFPDPDTVSATPMFLQPKLLSPDLRIYRVGARWFAFRIESEHLDYRVAPARMEAVPLPEALVERLGRLTDRLGLDFAAADFKRCGETGRMLFLEVNSSPMFAGADRACDGALSRSIVERLTL